MPLAHTVEEISLQNGAKGLLIHVPATTSVGYEFSFRGGDDYAARPEIQQVAHILEHMMFGANARFATTEQFSQEFTKYGADFNATTYSTTVDYYGRSARRELERMLDLWKLALCEPVFTEEILATEKANVRDELAGYEDDYDQVLEQRIDRAIGYSMPMESEKVATIGNVTLADVREHYHRTHTLANMRFIIAGDISAQRQEIIRSLEAWELPRGERLPIASESLHAGDPVCIVRPDTSTCTFRLAFALNRYLNQKEADAMVMLDHILTGTFHSRIYGRARSLGLCYDISSSFDRYYAGVSEWTFSAQVQPAAADALFALIREQLEHVAAGDITEAEAEDARQYALGWHEMRDETVEGLVNTYSGNLSLDEPLQLLADAPRMIRQTELKTAIGLAREFLASDICGFGEIGNVTRADVDRHGALFSELARSTREKGQKEVH